MRAVAVLSDSHGYALPPALLDAFKKHQVEACLHAGDLAGAGGESAAQLLREMQAVARTTAVMGNTDKKADNPENLPAKACVSVGAVRFFLHHGDRYERVGIASETPETRTEVLDALEPDDGWRPGFDVVVSGHSHKAHWFVDEQSGVAFLNPGATTRKRFLGETPRQAALVQWCDGGGGSGSDGGTDATPHLKLLKLSWGAEAEQQRQAGADGAGLIVEEEWPQEAGVRPSPKTARKRKKG